MRGLMKKMDMEGVNRAFTAGFERAVHCFYVSNEPRFTVNDAHDM